MKPELNATALPTYSQETPEQHTDSSSDIKRRISYSQYAMWSACPLQWRLKYVDKLMPKDETIHLAFGTAMHLAIQQWLDKLYNKGEYKAKIFDMEGVFKDELLKLFKESIKHDADGNPTYLCDQATLMEFYRDGLAILAYIRKEQKQFFPTKNHKLIGCEIPLELKLTEGVTYIGYIDIVIKDEKNDELFIFDLKTSGKGWFYEKKDPKKLNQLLLYKAFYAQQFDVDPKSIRVQFIILKRKLQEQSEWPQHRVTRFEPAQGKGTVKKAQESLEAFIEAAFHPDGSVRLDNLPATPSKNSCRFCYFRDKPDLCPSPYTEPS